jgi:rfaE bifunctional protein nucleotidyltransferase chain/domain
MQKIFEISALGEIAAQARSQGKKIVLAHGTFDLLHFGHVRHLEAARCEGDILFVTLTADRFVNKGPGRPIFNQNIRAEMLSALSCVDYVGICNDRTAEAAIQAIKPSVYVKGSDYANHDDDVTGKIRDEKRLVEQFGGRLIFTDEVTFSSSNLINQHLDVYDPPLRDFLADYRRDGLIDELNDYLDKMRQLRVLVIGDAICDEYRYVQAMGRSAKENIIATRFEGSEMFAGGVFAAANHVASFCEHVEIMTAIGTNNDREDFIRANLASNVSMWSLPHAGAPTTTKTRFIDVGYLRKLFEVYEMDDTPLNAEEEQTFIDTLRMKLKQTDVVVVTDFGHGLITPRIIEVLVKEAPFLAVNTQTNSANIGFNLVSKYPRADYICIDSPEAHLAVHDKYVEVNRVAAELLPSIIDVNRLVVTCGKHGCVTWSREEGLSGIPAFTRTVLDTVGAGDAYFVVTAPLVALGVPMLHVGVIGNAAGALKVGIVGHRSSVERPAMQKYLQTLLK